MPLSKQFREEVKKVTESWIGFINNSSPEDFIRPKKAIKYDNHKDFWHGYFLGSIEGQLIQGFLTLHGREIADEERAEMEEIISSYDKPLLDAIKRIE